MEENKVDNTNEILTHLYKLLLDVILPTLKEIQATQKELSQQSEWLSQGIDEFRTEMKSQFGELHSELAVCRSQIEETMGTLRETKAIQALTGNAKVIIH